MVASVYRVDTPFVVRGRQLRRGDLVVVRPDHPDPERRFVVEGPLTAEAALEMFAQNELRGYLTPLGVVAPSSSPSTAPDLSPPTDRRQRSARGRKPLILEL